MNYSLSETTFQEEIYSVPVKTVVVLKTAWEKLNDDEQTLLDKILSLGNLSLNHIQLVIDKKIDFTDWSTKPLKVIAFGLNDPGLPLNEVIDVKGIKIIITQDLKTLSSAEKETKQKLAAAVKALSAL